MSKIIKIEWSTEDKDKCLMFKIKNRIIYLAPIVVTYKGWIFGNESITTYIPTGASYMSRHDGSLTWFEMADKYVGQEPAFEFRTQILNWIILNQQELIEKYGNNEQA